MTIVATDTRSVPVTVIDHRRGSQAMVMFIITEAVLFLVFFFAYYYLGHDAPKWPTELPKLPLALTMLVLLLASSVVLYMGEEAGKKGEFARAKAWTAGTVLMGAVFLSLQTLEYREHLKTLRPTDNAYGSIFYTITSFHAAHLVLGLLMLIYVLILPSPQLGKAEKPPHHSLHNAALYWHFVDVVWVFLYPMFYLLQRYSA